MEDNQAPSARLRFDPEATRLERWGLLAAGQGDFETAYDHFSEARAILDPQPPSIFNSLQLAILIRNLGFTHVRKAVELFNQNPVERYSGDLQLGYFLLRYAQQTTSNLIRNCPNHPRTMSYVPEICTEHGATLGYLGRTLTLALIVPSGIVVDANDSPENVYPRAYQSAIKGNDGGCRTEVCIFAARDACARQTGDGGVWARRILKSLGWTIFCPIFLNEVTKFPNVHDLRTHPCVSLCALRSRCISRNVFGLASDL